MGRVQIGYKHVYRDDDVEYEYFVDESNENMQMIMVPLLNFYRQVVMLFRRRSMLMTVPIANKLARTPL